MTSPTISVGGLTRRYRGQLALDDVTFDVQGASITGLLGRNGAGKTTLLRIIAGHEFASAGSVTVLDASPIKDEEVLRRMVYIREDQTYPDFKVRHALRVASWFYPNWSHELAEALVADFGLPLNRRIKKLSRGMRSAVGIVIGLAVRAEITLFDEPYGGLDAAQIIVLVGGAALASATHAWPTVGRFFTTLSVTGLTGLLAALAAVLLAGGFTTVRRVTV